MYPSNKSATALLCAAWLLIVSVAAVSCSKEPRTAYVARVNQTLLTEAELETVRDSAREGRRRNLEDINNWVTTELLYQEAVRRGLADTDDIRRQLETTRKRLAINALLERELYGTDSALVNEREMLDLYNSGSQDFRLREDVIRASLALFSERNAANDFRSRILRGKSWTEALSQIQNDSLLKPTLLQAVNRQYFSKTTLFPEELWRVARTLAQGEVSFALAANGGYYILMAHSAKRQGEIPEWDYVRDELRERLLIERRRKLYDNLLATLRTRHSVEIRMELADTSTSSE